ncbi:MAG: hypothetical protein Q9208_005714 [Pyrenodesmia sp. 3 TL-2023]
MPAPSSIPPSQSKSPHLADPSLQPFLSPSFSATTYLNTHLPSPPSSTTLSKPTPTTTTTPPQQSLTSITAQTQTHISTLSAQTTRLSATLTALADDILRCSTRLGYEIEVLRGDADGLVSALTSPGSELSAAIKTFVPNGLQHPSSNTALPDVDERPPTAILTQKAPPTQDGNATSTTTEESLTHLRTLLSVRHALQRITQLFSLALAWPMPPSLLSSSSSSSTITSSLISVSSPASQQEVAEQEEKGRAALARLRGEVETLLAGPGDEGLEKARRRVEELRECVGVWKGTGEERARERWVKELETWEEGEAAKRGKREGSGSAAVGRDENGGERRERVRGEVPSRTGSGAGFLRRLRDEIYLE